VNFFKKDNAGIQFKTCLTMFTIIKKIRSAALPVWGLFLMLTGYSSTAQTDSTAGKKLLKDTITAVVQPQQKLIPSAFFRPVPQRINSFSNNRLFMPYPYNPGTESNASKTILKILGIGALSIFGDRTNHPYQPYNQH
jgi:hypothetical protein